MSKKNRISRWRCGFTLIETMIVIAIIILLIGIFFLTASPAREKARQTSCRSNLKQIGHAIALYRQDYGGEEEGRYFEMGLPPSPVLLAELYLGWKDKSKPPVVWSCPDYVPRTSGVEFSYTWHIFDNKYGDTPGHRVSRYIRAARMGFDFPDLIKLRGGDYPVVGDPWHNHQHAPNNSNYFFIALRLDGRVTSHYVSHAQPDWEW